VVVIRPAALLVRAGLACGILAPLWWGAMIAYCGAHFPDYHHATQFISELAARGSPTQDLMRDAGFIFTGVLYVLFAAAAAWQLRANWCALIGTALIALAGFARLGAGLYACEPGCDPAILSSAQDWHHRYASGGYGLMMLAAVVTGFGVKRELGLQHLLAWGIGTAMWCAVFLFLMTTNEDWAGGYQRLASGVLSLWILVFALSLWRASMLPGQTAAGAGNPPVGATPQAQPKSRRRRR
jgi:hypothetical protein